MCSLSYSPSSPGPSFDANPAPSLYQVPSASGYLSLSIVRSTMVVTCAVVSAENLPTKTSG